MRNRRGARSSIVMRDCAIKPCSPANAPHAGELVPLTSNFTNSASGIIAASINGKTADALLAPTKKTLKQLQTALDNENPHVQTAFVLPKVRATLACGVEHLKKTDSNVVAYLS